MRYRITGSGGIDLGIYEADTPRAAVQALNRDAGYPTDEAALEVTGQGDIMAGLAVEKLDSQPCIIICEREFYAGTNAGDRARPITDELINGCPEESRADHETIAAAIRRGDSWETIEKMPELNRWPETHHWLSVEMKGEKK